MSKIKAPMLCCLLLALSGTPAFATPFTYQESVSGDLWYWFPHTPFTFDVGVNTVSGTSSYSETIWDADSFAFLIPAGTVLTAIEFSHVTTFPAGGMGNMQVGLASGQSDGSTWPTLIVPMDYLYLHTGSPLVPFSGATPLPAGLYSLWHAGTGRNTAAGWSSDYTWSFTVESVPDSASSLLLLGMGLGGLHAWRKRHG